MGLGELQQMTMLAVARLGDEAYGAAVRDELRRVGKRTVAIPTVHVALVRLEDQGLVVQSCSSVWRSRRRMGDAFGTVIIGGPRLPRRAGAAHRTGVRRRGRV